ncbi:MAG TPA: hypothetical protein PLB99_12855 [Thermotogota bacterium]|nr:hypothetical protein [Thermotogota bacterium]
MNKKKFNSVFSIFISDLIKKIIIEESITEEEAIDYLYTSKLYKLLEDEQTKVWQYSTPLLYDLLKTEKEQGVLTLPQI